MIEDCERGRRAWQTRIRGQQAGATQKISEVEARLREVARMHRPKLKRLYIRKNQWCTIADPRLFEGTEIVLNHGIVRSPNCMPLEPAAVHAMRRYKRIMKEAACMIEEGLAQPDEIRFMCSEFLILRRNKDDLLVRFGERRIPYHIRKVCISYAKRAVTFDDATTIKVNSPGLYSYYLGLYSILEKERERCEQFVQSDGITCEEALTRMHWSRYSDHL